MKKRQHGGEVSDPARIEPADNNSQRGRRRLRVIVGGRAEDVVRRIDRQLARSSLYDCRIRVVTNGHTDPLHGVIELPDALVFVLSAGWKEELEALANRPVAARPAAVIIGPADNVDAVRLAMRAGAKDYFSLPEDPAAIEKVLNDIGAEIIATDENASASLISVVNAKGGSGATFIATSIAQIMAAHLTRKTALLDLDLQFSSIADYTDVELKHGLTEVFRVAGELDELALESYMTVDKNGLYVLGARDDGLRMDADIDEERFFKILTLLSSCFQHVVIDLPRHLTEVTVQAIEQSTIVLVVVQQSLASLKDAAKLLAILRNDLAINNSRIKIIINRFDKTAEITQNDIGRALCLENISLVPNDFERVAESLNTGIPVFCASKSAPITKALSDLASDLAGQVEQQKSSLFDVAISGIRGVLHKHARNRL